MPAKLHNEQHPNMESFAFQAMSDVRSESVLLLAELLQYGVRLPKYLYVWVEVPKLSFCDCRNTPGHFIILGVG